ncbi:hypothetical protein BH09BAC3_BH09BAC3_08510 [soil metagenome]
MKRLKVIVCGMVVMASFMAFGQGKTEEMRMEQDIEVAENILVTLVRQQYAKRAFFPTEVNGSYTAGYGVTFRMPQNNMFNGMVYNLSPNTENFTPNGITYVYGSSWSSDDEGQNSNAPQAERMKERQPGQRRSATGTNNGTPTITTTKPRAAIDSLAATASQRFLDVAKNFLADYGDVISQLKPDERIIITNRAEEFGGFGFNNWGVESRRTMISVEAKRDDILQLKQGKITRDQFLKKLVIVNSETSEKLDPDLEVLSSMFSRLYREDLSTTYYSQGDVGYERLKNFGVVYYMRVYSSIEQGDDLFAIPTLSVNNVSQVERDKKVKELYPAFERELKDNLVEYGRTLRSLKDDEQVVINVKLTKCVACAIPADVEVSVKNSILKDYSSGKITKDAALSKVNVKKTGIQ